MKDILRKLLIMSLLIVYLFGCTPMNMNNVIKEPNFLGIVEEVFDSTILLKVDEDQNMSSDLIIVSTNTKLKDSFKDFQIGQKVRVYYNGVVAESYPAQVSTVYAILLVESE